jgi:anaerobic selenocysteine-containing dehydrogenase
LSDAERLGVEDGDAVTVSNAHGSITVPAAITERMLDGVVWLPTNSTGCAVRVSLRAEAGAPVDVVRAEGAAVPAATREVEVSDSAYTSAVNTEPVTTISPESTEGVPR